MEVDSGKAGVYNLKVDFGRAFYGCLFGGEVFGAEIAGHTVRVEAYGSNGIFGVVGEFKACEAAAGEVLGIFRRFNGLHVFACV